MSEIRAICTDIDGTLIRPDDSLSPRVRAALHAARERGCEIVLCTGRSRYLTQPIAAALGEPAYAVCSSGAVVMHLTTEEVIVRNVMPAAVGAQVCRLFLEHGIQPHVHEDAIRSARILYHPALPDYPFGKPSERHVPCPEMAERLPFEPITIVAYGDEAYLSPLARELRTRLPDGLHIIESFVRHKWCIEVHCSASSKQLSIERLMTHLSVEREQVLALGDHVNDIEMLQWAGVGVAMGGSRPEVQAAADWVTTSVHEDGVAVAVERFVLHVSGASVER